MLLNWKNYCYSNNYAWYKFNYLSPLAITCKIVSDDMTSSEAPK